MNICTNCDHAEFAHRNRTFGTTEKSVCDVAGCECVRAAR